MPPLRICIDARIPDGPHEGAGAVIRGLASAFSEITNGEEEYFFLVCRDSHEWFRPYLKGPCRLLLDVVAPQASAWKRIVKKLPEEAGMEVMHFISQGAFITRVPSIYQPHDLQHLHLPRFFTRRVRLRRELQYRAFCWQAKFVAAMSLWGREDLIENYSLPSEKVIVVPWAPVLTAYPNPSLDDLDAVRQKFSLPDAFVFYPAHTWQHKNHIILLEALAVLKKRGLQNIALVCSGSRDEFFSKIQARMRSLRLDDQVRFLGFVSAMELQCLYRLSRCLVFPSKFEGWGLPLMEAFLAGTPVACSNISPLREQAAGAALLFAPHDPEDTARALHRLWTDELLRKTLVRRGSERVALFSWKHTARIFRAYYRILGHRTLTEEDRTLLSAAPLV